MKWNWVIVSAIGISYFLLGCLVMLDQYVRIGVWIQWQDLFHHETLALAFFALGVGVFIGLISQTVLRAVE
jgi:hypothetical protein